MQVALLFLLSGKTTGWKADESWALERGAWVTANSVHEQRQPPRARGLGAGQ